MLIGDWDGYIDIIQSVLEGENDNIIALKFASFYYIARVGNIE